MYKKSELYTMFIQEFFSQQESGPNRNRLSIFENDKRELVQASQQAAIESTAEILLELLCRIGVIENDCTIDSEYRHQAIMNVAKDIVNNSPS